MNKIELSKHSFRIANEHGFLIGGNNTPENLNDAIGELQEGSKHIRERGSFAFISHSQKKYINNLISIGAGIEDWVYRTKFDNTVEMELADTELRLFTLAHYYSITDGCEMDWRESRYSMELSEIAKGLKTYAELSLHCSYYIGKIARASKGGKWIVRADLINAVIESINAWCEKEGINIEWFIGVKMNYNEGREYLHGRGSL